MNYCPSCKREYKEMSGSQTRCCPVCRSTLIQISEDALEKVRKDTRQKE